MKGEPFSPTYNITTADDFENIEAKVWSIFKNENIETNKEIGEYFSSWIIFSNIVWYMYADMPNGWKD